MNINIGLISSLILATLGLSACTPKTVTPVTNRAPVTAPTVETPPVEGQNEISNFTNVDERKQFRALNLEDLSSGLGLNQNPGAKNVLNSIVLPLARVLFSPAVYGSSDVSLDKFSRSLRLFHQTLLYVDSKDAALLANSKVLERYKRVLFQDCDENLQGTCPNLNTFGSEGRFPQVMLLLARNETQVTEYYRILSIALERYSAVVNGDLNYMYLVRANELARTYAELKTREDRLSQAALDRLRTHARITQNVLNTFDPKSADKTKIDKLLENFNPWDMSRKTSDILNFDIDKVFALMDRGYLYNEDGTLNSVFSRKVKEILDGDNSEYGLGAHYIFKYILQGNCQNENDTSDSCKKNPGNSKAILTNFDLAQTDRDGKLILFDGRPISRISADEYTYLVDRVFYGHFTADDAAAFWGKTQKDRTKLFEAVSSFTKLQIAYMVVWTNERMNEFFMKSMSSDSGTSVVGGILSLLQQAVGNSLKWHAEWDRILTRVQDVTNFVDSEFGRTDIFSLPPQDPYRVFSDQMTTLRQNVKMLSVYPNMMMLVYLMGKENFQDTINTFWGPITITAETIIEGFFVKVMAPWFSFGTDSTSLSQVELLYSIHFALQTETFTSYKSNPILPVTASTFFQEITNRLLNLYVQQMTDQRNALRTVLTSNRDTLNTALSACQIEREIQNQEAINGDGKILPRNYSRKIPYASMSSYLANGFGGNGRTSPMSAITAIIGGGVSAASFDKQLDAMRVDINSRVLHLENMKSILVTYLQETGGDVAGVTKVYDDEVSRFTKLRDEFLLSIHTVLNQIGDCDLVLYKHEADLRNALYQREVEYLTWVQASLTELNELAKSNPAEAESKLQALNQTLADRIKDDSALPQSYRTKGGYDRFVKGAQGYSYEGYKFDALMRTRLVIQELSGGNTQIVLPNFDELDVAEYQSPTVHAMEPWTLSTPQAFIADGMRQYIINTAMESALTPSFLIKKLNMLTELYRLGPINAETGTIGCVSSEKVSCLEITPERIMDLTFKILEIANVSESDLKVLKWSSQTQKFSDAFWTDISMEPRTRRPLNFLDLTFQRIVSDGEVSSGGMSSILLDSTRTYFEKDAAIGTSFLFQPRQSVKDAITANYARYVQDYVTKSQAFIDAYRAMQAKDPYQRTVVQRTVNDQLTIGTETIDGKERPEYISGNRMNRYLWMVNNFNARTAHKFEKK